MDYIKVWCEWKQSGATRMERVEIDVGTEEMPTGRMKSIAGVYENREHREWIPVPGEIGGPADTYDVISGLYQKMCPRWRETCLPPPLPGWAVRPATADEAKAIKRQKELVFIAAQLGCSPQEAEEAGF